MALNRGKQFEYKISEDIQKCFGDKCFWIRLNDQMSGYKTVSQNLCDFILFNIDKLILIEAKSCKGNTFPLTNLSQYEKLKYKVGIPGVRAGVFLWFIEHKRVAYVPISTITKLKEDGKKSVNVKMLDSNEYNIKVIPSITKRVFPDCDYSILMELQDGE